VSGLEFHVTHVLASAFQQLGGVVEMRTVEVARTEGETAAISKGLEPGETVVTDSIDKLQQGGKVQVGQPGRGGTAGASETRGAHGGKKKS